MNFLKKTLSLVLALIILSTSLMLSGCQLISQFFPDDDVEDVHIPVPDPTDDNYRTFYQIFVGSFSDSNNDTFGDLRGIINRFDYLNDGDINSGKDLGVQGIWLSPIFSSPSYHKYDAKDYYKIDWRFGDHNDLKELADLCESRNVKLILDLVLNHTSGQNDWFVQFKEARMKGDTSNKYYDYYTCVTAAERVNGRNYTKIGGVDAYYEVNFSGDMPELNYDNPEVKEEMLNVAKYYIDLGVDGFRFDAVKYIYFGDTAANVEFWEWYMSELKAYKPDIYCVGECWSSESEILEYYSAMNCFNFAMSGAEGQAARAAKGASLSSFINYIETYQDKVQQANPTGMPMQFLANHDQDRIAGAFILPDYMKMAASLYLLSPGSPFIYYGEEIGMKGSRGAAMTDANRRLAMLWGDGDTVKDPVGTTYSIDKQINGTVASQLEDENSLLSHYAKVINVRTKYPAIARGEYNMVSSTNKNFAGFYVEYNGEILGIIHNNSLNEISMPLSDLKGLDGHSFDQLCEILGSSAKLEDGVLTIAAYTSVILK
jgi:glycosidase